MPQRTHVSTGNFHRRHVEELQLFERTTVQLLDDIPGARSLDLKTPYRSRDGLAHRPRRRAVVEFEVNVVAAVLGLEAKPVGCRRTADVNELFLGQVENYAVTDDMAVWRGRDILLGLVDRKSLHGVGGRVGQQLERVFAPQVQIHHVMGLVEKYHAVLPGPLFHAPVVKFGRDDRIDIRSDPRVAQHADNVALAGQYLLQVGWSHELPLLCLPGVSAAGVAPNPSI